MENHKPLTKGQRRRANERRKNAISKQFDAVMGAPPDHVEAFFASSVQNTIRHRDPWENAPPHMVEVDDDGQPSLNKTALGRAATAGGKERGARRTDDMVERRSELSRNHSEALSKRGHAKKIAGELSDEGSPVSERTIQRDLKALKK